MDLTLASSFVTDATDATDKVSPNLVSSIVVDAAHTLTNCPLENIDLTLASSLVTDATDKVSPNLVSNLETDVAPTLTNGTLKNMDLTLASSLVTNSLANSGLSTPSLFYFSHILLPFTYNYLTGCSIQVI